jgi:hypothetical protein
MQKVDGLHANRVVLDITPWRVKVSVKSVVLVLIVIALYPVNVLHAWQANIPVQALLSVKNALLVITVLKAVVHICSAQQVQ